jgi:hypothetical protein
MIRSDEERQQVDRCAVIIWERLMREVDEAALQSRYGP